jgi:hypothetical protein
MTRSLRTWHRRLIAGVFFVLLVSAVIALTHRVPDVRLDSWPEALQGPARAKIMLPLGSPRDRHP